MGSASERPRSEPPDRRSYDVASATAHENSPPAHSNQRHRDAVQCSSAHTVSTGELRDRVETTQIVLDESCTFQHWTCLLPRHSTLPSLGRKCYPCRRSNLLPMSPGLYPARSCRGLASVRRPSRLLFRQRDGVTAAAVPAAVLAATAAPLRLRPAGAWPRNAGDRR